MEEWLSYGRAGLEQICLEEWVYTEADARLIQ